MKLPTFLRPLGERAAKTFAQTLLAALTLTSGPIDVFHADWTAALSLAVTATLLSVLTSIVASFPISGGSGLQTDPAVPAASGASLASLRQLIQADLAALDPAGTVAPPAPAAQLDPPVAAVESIPQPDDAPVAADPAVQVTV